jgi:transcriptional regulator with XRE-family HTH domain
MKPTLKIVNKRHVKLKFKRLFPDSGDRLWALRQTLGYTQKQMGEECDLSHSAIGGFERGYTLGQGRSLVKIAKGLGISVDFLLNLSDSQNIHDATIPIRKMRHA